MWKTVEVTSTFCVNIIRKKNESYELYYDYKNEDEGGEKQLNKLEYCRRIHGLSFFLHFENGIIKKLRTPFFRKIFGGLYDYWRRKKQD
ncbi:hypothetical protein SAMN02910382_02997 [Butyrivibrio sp. TB]|nr:hypothetical protein SAMN02910382_02997 [Butyrivibrio sp. TB]